MKAEDICYFLKSIKPRVEITEKQIFNPLERHIELSFDKTRGIDPVAYLTFYGEGKPLTQNEELVPKLVYFLNKTKNSPLAREVRDNLG